MTHDDPTADPSDALPTVPWSNEAEQSVLGGLLLDNTAWDRVGDLLVARHFFAASHAGIFEAIGALVKAAKPADVVTVFYELQRRGQADEVGGLAYLNALAGSVPSAANARRYAEIVIERYADRVLRRTADEALGLAQGPGTPAVRLEAIAARFDALARRHVRAMPVGLGGILSERLNHLNDLHERGDAPTGWSTGIAGLDALLLGGFQPGRLYLLGGRPSVGKSALAQWFALLGALHQDLVALYLSQEMGHAEVGDRSLAMVGQVSYERIQTGRLHASEWSAVSRAVEDCSRIAFSVDEQAGLKLGEIRTKARFVKGLQLLVVDYVQLCQGAEEGEANRNTELEVISRGLKVLAKELGCAVLVLSQLARRVEDRPHQRPIMSDLKDCGGLEQDADVVMSLFRIKAMPASGYELIGLDLLKGRQIKRGSVVLEFHGDRLGWAESQYLLSDLLAKPVVAKHSKEL